jgi:hypothetical protein
VSHQGTPRIAIVEELDRLDRPGVARELAAEQLSIVEELDRLDRPADPDPNPTSE